MSKMLRKLSLIGLVIIFLVSLGAVIGCESEADVEVTLGKYVNQDDASKYIELKADGTFDQYAEEGMLYSGEWEIKGSTIIFSVEVQGVVLEGGGTVEGNVINDNDGLVWKLEE